MVAAPSALVLASGIAGCGGSAERHDPGPTTTTGSANAAAFAQAAARFEAVVEPKIRAAAEADAGGFNRCPAVTLTPKLPSEKRLFIVTEVAMYRAIAGAYAAYAESLREIPTSDPTLRQAASGGAALSRRYRVLRDARPDECRVLRAWRAVGWVASFDVRPLIGVADDLLDEDGADPNQVARRASRASRAIDTAGRRLSALGVSPRAAKTFTVVTDLLSSRALFGN
jgi:hypothetical protein